MCIPYLCVVSQYDVKFAEVLQCVLVAMQSLVDESKVVHRLDTRRVRLYRFSVAIARFLQVASGHQDVAFVNEGSSIVPVCLNGQFGVAISQIDRRRCNGAVTIRWTSSCSASNMNIQTLRQTHSVQNSNHSVSNYEHRGQTVSDKNTKENRIDNITFWYQKWADYCNVSGVLIGDVHQFQLYIVYCDIVH